MRMLLTQLDRRATIEIVAGLILVLLVLALAIQTGAKDWCLATAMGFAIACYCVWLERVLKRRTVSQVEALPTPQLQH